MISETYSTTTGDYTLTCDRCGYSQSDPTIKWLVSWFRHSHKGCN